MEMGYVKISVDSCAVAAAVERAMASTAPRTTLFLRFTALLLKRDVRHIAVGFRYIGKHGLIS